MSQKFFKTTITVVIISEECPVSELGLTDIAYQISQGDCSGEITKTEVVPLTPGQAAQALIEQGSDPDFLGLGEVTPEAVPAVAATALAPDPDIAPLRAHLKEREALFEANGGRGVELAEEIDGLRRQIAALERAPVLEAMKQAGLTYQDCLPVLAAPEDDPYVEAARQLIAGDDDLSMDDRTITSDSDGGVWVLGWIWVSDEEAGVERKETDEVTA